MCPSSSIFRGTVFLSISGRLQSLELLVMPRHAGLDLVEINVFSVLQKHRACETTVLVNAGAAEIDCLVRNKFAEVLGRSRSVRLTVLWSINPRKTNFALLSGLSENFDGIAVDNSRDFAGLRSLCASRERTI